MRSDKFKHAHVVVLLFGIMTVLGFVGNLRGVLLPSIKKDLNISYTDIGFMIFVTSLGYFASTFLTGFAGDKFGQKKVMVFAFIIITTGLTGVFFINSFFLLLVTMLVLNVGMGSFDISLNSLAPSIFLKNTAVMFSFLHVFYGLGSAASPEVASFMLAKNIRWSSIYLSALALVGFVFILFVTSPLKPSYASKSAEKLPFSTIIRDKRIPLFIGVLGFCASAEIGISTWLINFLQVERGMSNAVSARYMFFYFLIYTVGRIFGGFISQKLGFVRTVIAFTTVSTLLMVSGLMLDRGWTFLFSLLGFFISIMYPTNIMILSREFTHGLSSVLGVVATAAGLMSVGTNWIIGKINDSYGVLAGFVALPVSAAIAVILMFVLRRFLVYDKRLQGEISA